MKRALIILTPGFAKDEEDTTCIPVLQQYVLEFSRLRPDVHLTVIAFQYPFKEGHYKWNRADIYSAGGASSKYGRLFTWLKVYREMKRRRKQNDNVIVHSYWLTECALVGQWFAKFNKVLHVAYVIGQDALKTNRYLKLLNFSKMKMVAMSDSIANKLFETTRYRVQNIIPAGVFGVSVQSGGEERVIDIIGVGALTPLKNYSLFVDVIKKVKKSIPSVKAVIVGKGPQEGELREKIGRENLKENIELVGELPHNEVLRYLNRSKLFLHTSTYEGQSTVLMEAISSGLPVVCFDVGRVDAGTIIVCRDMSEMVEQVNILLSGKIDYVPVIPFTMEDTVRGFCKIYGI